MDGMRSSQGQPAYARQPRIDATLAGGAAGGLIGLMLGPIGTLACAAIGAGLGYLAYRGRAHPARRRAALLRARKQKETGGFWNC